ncbi:MAG: ATP-binding protein [Bacteroidales bacterium]|nr:ATP-binding protein [Bacteroidales bacterium]
MIGREQEIRELNERYDSNRPEFIAVYGRRRVGKTYLVDETLKERITFRHSGLSPVDEQNHKNGLKEQLKHFYLSLQLHGMKKSRCPSSWLDAFFMLEMHLKSIDDGSRQVIFWTNCHGWTPHVRASSPLWRHFGTDGQAIATT